MSAADITKFLYWFRLGNGSIPIPEFETKYSFDPLSFPTSILFDVKTEEDMDSFLERIKGDKDELLSTYSDILESLKKGTLETIQELMRIFGAVLTYQLVSYHEKSEHINDLKEALKVSSFYDATFAAEIQLSGLENGLTELQKKQEAGEFNLQAILAVEILKLYFDSKNPLLTYHEYLKNLQEVTYSEEWNQVCMELYLVRKEEMGEFYSRARQDDLSVLLRQFRLAILKFDALCCTEFNAEQFCKMLFWLGALVTNPRVSTADKVICIAEVVEVVSLLHCEPKLMETFFSRKRAMTSVISYFAANDEMINSIDVVAVCAMVLCQEKPTEITTDFALEHGLCVLNGLKLLIDSLEEKATPLEVTDCQIEVPTVEKDEKSVLTEPEVFALLCGSGLHKGAQIRFKYVSDTNERGKLHDLLVKLKELAAELSPLPETYPKWVEFVDCLLKVLKFSLSPIIFEFLLLLLGYIRKKFVHFEQHEHQDVKKTYRHLDSWYKDMTRKMDNCSKTHPLKLITYCVMMVEKLYGVVDEVYPQRSKYWEMFLVQLFVLIVIVSLCMKERQSPRADKTDFHFKKDEEFTFLAFVSFFGPPAATLAVDVCKYRDLEQEKEEIYKLFSALSGSVNQTAAKEDVEEKRTSKLLCLQFLFSVYFAIVSFLANEKYSAEEKLKALLSCVEKLPKIIEALIKVKGCENLVASAGKEVLKKYEELHKLINHHELHHHEHSVLLFVIIMEEFYEKARDDSIDRIVVITGQLLTLILLYLILIKFKHPHLPLHHEFTKVVDEIQKILNSVNTQGIQGGDEAAEDMSIAPPEGFGDPSEEEPTADLDLE